MYVYLLLSGKKTYVGATVDVNRRLRQHNREIKGGAKYTSKDIWTRVCYVSGFPTWKDALQFEWKWKQLSRKVPSKQSLQRRLEALNVLIASGKSTSTSRHFDTWEVPLCIHET
jgi:predicted GIY-YIG superfamily endonuclease